MTNFISHLHTDLRIARLTRRGVKGSPQEENAKKHKEYKRMPRIVLPEPEEGEWLLKSALEKRHSTFGGSQALALSLQDIGTLLGLSARSHKESEKRNYPSGGARFPVEVYLLSHTFEGTEGGVFHYHPTDHVLERLWDVPEDIAFSSLIRGPAHLDAACLLICTSVWKRSASKYGDYAYPLALLEAGHLSQNVLLISTALGIESRPFSSFQDQQLTSLLDINDNEEQPIHVISLARFKHLFKAEDGEAYE